MASDLIIIDVRLHDGRKQLDFSSAIFLKVEELIKLGIFDRTTELLSKLIELTKAQRISTARDFREELRGGFGIDWIKALVLSMFPAAVTKLARTEAVLGGGTALRTD